MVIRVWTDVESRSISSSRLILWHLRACHRCQVIAVDVNETTVWTLKPEVRYLPDWLGLSLLLFDNQGNERLRAWFRFLDWLCLIRICPLVFLQPFVIDAFILAVLAEAAPVSMLVKILHHFLEIFLCLHYCNSLNGGRSSSAGLLLKGRKKGTSLY